MRDAPATKTDDSVIDQTVSRLLCGLAALSLVAAPVAASAQAAAEANGNALDIPASVTILGKSDPNVRKPTAVVNGQIITGTDVDQRAALVVAASKGKIEPEEMQRLRTQVLRNLIDETLEIQ